jgi:hypothetical protein
MGSLPEGTKVIRNSPVESLVVLVVRTTLADVADVAVNAEVAVLAFPSKSPINKGAYTSPLEDIPALDVILFKIASEPDTITFFQFGILFYFYRG